MGLWAKASRARRTGRGIRFIGPPWLPEAHFIGTLQHRVSPASRRLRKAARDWAALRVRQALTQDGISFVVEPVLDGPMPPRLAAFAWAGLRLVGLVAVHLDHLLQTRKGQRRLRWYEPAKPTARRCVPDGSSTYRPAGTAAGARPNPSARPDCPCDGGSGAPFLQDDLGRLGRVQGILASARAAPTSTRPRLIPGRFALQPAQGSCQDVCVSVCVRGAYRS
jgi:hypothetical protein